MTDTQSIKDKLDIVQVIQEYLPLKKSGANWKAPCPFHREKSPSFMVHPEKQIFHCFGCGKGGDIFTFVQEIEGIDFPEALKLLADRAGVKLENNFKTEVNKSQKNRLMEIDTRAAYFFHRFLMDMPTAKIARDYLERRGLKKETIERWKIGFIPDQWELLTKYLLKNGFGIDDLVVSGLTIKRDNADVKTGRGFYDRFRGRVMFPIWDVHGNVVGFTGRVLVETENSGGKYVNTPQSPVYDKSRVIYGLDKAKMEIKAKDLVVLVEGQMDVVACHQAGMTNVVAASGTALTLEQIKLLKRYSNNIAMAFDADSAGQNAAKRGIDIALQEGMNIRVIKIPDGAGKDADECLKKNPKIWFEAVEKSKGVMEWYFEKVLGKINRREPKEKQTASNILLTEIAKIPYAVERDEWLKRLGEELNIEMSILREEIKNNKQRVGAVVEDVKNSKMAVPPIDKMDPVHSRLFSLLLKYPNLYIVNPQALRIEFFVDTRFAPLYELFEKHYNTNDFNPDTWRANFVLPNGENFLDLLRLQVDSDYEGMNEKEASGEVGILIKRIKDNWIKIRRDEIQTEMLRAEKDGDREKVASLMQILQQLIN